MAVADGSGLPVAVWAGSASPHEVTLVEDGLDAKLPVGYPVRMIGDMAYDSGDLDLWIKEQYDTEVIASNRSRRKAMTQDGRKPRRYKRRLKIVQMFAWLERFSRIQSRWDHRLENYLAFVHLRCLLILLKYF